MDNSNVVLKQHRGPNSGIALVTLVGKRVAVYVVLEVSLRQECFATQVACMRPVIQVTVDVRLEKSLVCEAVATVRTYSVWFFYMHALHMGVFVGLRCEHHVTLVTLYVLLGMVSPFMVASSLWSEKDHGTL